MRAHFVNKIEHAAGLDCRLHAGDPCSMLLACIAVCMSELFFAWLYVYLFHAKLTPSLSLHGATKLFFLCRTLPFDLFVCYYLWPFDDFF